MEQVEREHERAGSLRIGVTVPNSIPYEGFSEGFRLRRAGRFRSLET